MDKEARDLRVLAQFTQVFCADHHGERERNELELQLPKTGGYRYCAECAAFLLYAIERRRRCPLARKPACKHCRLHCYRPGHREKVREIMRYAGRTLIRRGRIDLLWHYFF